MSAGVFFQLLICFIVYISTNLCTETRNVQNRRPTICILHLKNISKYKDVRLSLNAYLWRAILE